MYIAAPGTPVSKLVERAIPDIIFVSKSGVIKDRNYYVSKIKEKVKDMTIHQLANILEENDWTKIRPCENSSNTFGIRSIKNNQIVFTYS